MAFESEDGAPQTRNKNPREETEIFENDNRSEFEGVSESGEGDDSIGNDCQLEDTCTVSQHLQKFAVT